RPEERGQLDLNRVGVLELVDEDALVPLAQACARAQTMLRIAQQGTGEHEQVVELELAGGSPLADRACGAARERDHDPPNRGVQHPPDELLAFLPEARDA